MDDWKALSIGKVKVMLVIVGKGVGQKRRKKRGKKLRLRTSFYLARSVGRHHQGTAVVAQSLMGKLETVRDEVDSTRVASTKKTETDEGFTTHQQMRSWPSSAHEL